VKILVCLHDYLPNHPGGSEVHAHQSARELLRRGHEVTALYTERDLSAEEGSLRHGELDGVKTIECVHQREYADVRQSFEQSTFLAAFEEALAEVQPDVVHFHHLALWGSGVLPAAKRSGARVLITLHDYFLLCDVSTLMTPESELCQEGLRGECTSCLRRHPLRPELWPKEQRELPLDELWKLAARARFDQHRADLQAADLVISPSRFLADRFGEAGFFDSEAVEILRAGYPGSAHAPKQRDMSQPLHVGYVGGVYPSKGLHVLVKAMAHLKDAPLQLDLHGHLDWFPDYVETLRADAKGTRTAFHGPYPPAEVDRILGEFDVLVVPSIWYENMPITIQEAFRNGLPVVTTDLGGMSEAVTHNVDGLTFPRGDDRALAECLRSLATDAELYNRLASGRSVPPTLEEIVDRLEQLYRS
jgi:glycosyltransferase involved in cell wall biosynthesis